MGFLAHYTFRDEVDFEPGKTFFRCTFDQADLRDANMSGSQFVCCKFLDCRMSRANFGHTVWIGSDLFDCTLSYSRFTESQWKGDCLLENVYAEDTSFTGAYFFKTQILGSYFGQAFFDNAWMSQVEFVNNSWAGSVFSGATLHHVIDIDHNGLRHMALDDAKLVHPGVGLLVHQHKMHLNSGGERGARLHLRDTFVLGSALSRLDLRNATFTNVIIDEPVKDSDLRGATFERVVGSFVDCLLDENVQGIYAPVASDEEKECGPK